MVLSDSDFNDATLKNKDWIGDHFTDTNTLSKTLPGAKGDDRYSTTGETSLRNIQPFFVRLTHG